MTKPLPFTQASLQRAIRAARAEGLRIRGISISDGTVLVDDGENSPGLIPPMPGPTKGEEVDFDDVEA